MSCIAIIQARMGSTRLPNKVMADIAGHPMLWHVAQRVRLAGLKLFVATSDSQADSRIRGFCYDNHLQHYAGSEPDVLDRYYQLAVRERADTVVRITADCPLLDPEVVALAVSHFKAGDYDYVSVATGSPGGEFPDLGVFKGRPLGRYPDGLDAEVFSMAALRWAWVNTLRMSDRQHVTPWLWKNAFPLRSSHVWSGVELGHRRWTVDTAEDLEFVRRVYAALWSGNYYDRAFTTEQVEAFQCTL